jgi:hypothetical protein
MTMADPTSTNCSSAASGRTSWPLICCGSMGRICGVASSMNASDDSPASCRESNHECGWSSTSKAEGSICTVPPLRTTEGIVGKWRDGTYQSGPPTSWVKVRNPEYLRGDN